MHAVEQEKPNRRYRMGKLDYIFVCMKQTLAATNDTRSIPSHWLEAAESQQFQAEFNSHWYMAEELFGKRACSELDEQLYRVEELILAETAIATRMDLTHSEKIELIRPLRAK